jgi:hypothetical protein
MASSSSSRRGSPAEPTAGQAWCRENLKACRVMVVVWFDYDGPPTPDGHFARLEGLP